jgi:hypothetical protein
MKHFIKQLIRYFTPKIDPLNKKYGSRSTNEWHYDFRSVKKGTLDEIVDSIKSIEKILPEIELKEKDIIKLLLNSNSVPTLCLCCYAVTKVELISTEVETKLINLLSYPDESVRRFSAMSLTKIGSIKALSAVVEGNNHGHAIRTEAAYKIAKIGSQAVTAIPSLFKLLEYKKINWRTHFAAADALASIGNEAIEPLLKNLDSEDKNLRYYSAIALSSMKPKPITNPQINMILKKLP